MLIVSYKKSQIAYIDDLIFLGERIILLLNSTVPDTEILFKKLQDESRLKKYNIAEIYESSPLPEKENSQITELLSIIGRYDAQTQINCTQEFTGYYKDLKKQYQEYYNSHCRLYIVFSLSVGTVVSLLLI